MTALNANVRLSETDNKYTYLGPLISRAHSLEWGMFGQDSWRFRSNITLTFGFRYERQVPVEADNDTFATVSYAIYLESQELIIFSSPPALQTLVFLGRWANRCPPVTRHTLFLGKAAEHMTQPASSCRVLDSLIARILRRACYTI